MNDDLTNLFQYHREADERFVAACRSLSPEQYAEVEPFEVGWPSIRSVVVHLAWANDLWGRRLLGESTRPRVAEADLPTLDAAADLLVAAHDRFAAEVLPAMTPERQAEVWTYHDLQGSARSLPRWAALRHVVNHGTYHRGQLASKLKRRGVDPPATDFILWCLERSPQPGQ